MSYIQVCTLRAPRKCVLLELTAGCAGFGCSEAAVGKHSSLCSSRTASNVASHSVGKSHQTEPPHPTPDTETHTPYVLLSQLAAKCRRRWSLTWQLWCPHNVLHVSFNRQHLTGPEYEILQICNFRFCVYGEKEARNARPAVLLVRHI